MNPKGDVIMHTTILCRGVFSLASAVFVLTTNMEANQPRFIRGDCNVNGNIVEPVTEAMLLLTGFFVTAVDFRCPDACDANDDGQLDISDPVVILAHHFLGEPPFRAPYPACGYDPTPDDLGCDDALKSCDQRPPSSEL